MGAGRGTVGGLHHVELWVPDLDRAAASWGWLLGALGYEAFQSWPAGRSWRLGATYVVVAFSIIVQGLTIGKLGAWARSKATS